MKLSELDRAEPGSTLGWVEWTDFSMISNVDILLFAYYLVLKCVPLC